MISELEIAAIDLII